MKKSFNLRKHIKKAFYDDGRGTFNSQTRAWQNCYKAQCDQGKGPQEAWNACKEQFQERNNSNWAFEYAGNQDGGKRPRPDGKTPFLKK